MFGWIRRNTVTRERLTILHAYWIRGRIFKFMPTPDMEMELYKQFSEKVDEFMAARNVTEPKKLEPKTLFAVDAFHQAMFGTDGAFEDALTYVPATRVEILREIRSGAQTARQTETEDKQREILTREKAIANSQDLNEVIGNPTSTSEREEMLLAWLKGHGSEPALWHCIAITLDCDGGGGFFEWILNQPDCDCATAAYIFHCAASGGRLTGGLDPEDHPNGPSADLDLVVLACDRFSNNTFKTSSYGFELDCWMLSLDECNDEVDKLVKSGANIPFVIPNEFFQFEDKPLPIVPYRWEAELPFQGYYIPGE